ncbi:MAG TPA: nucleotidyltransferase domain-containing protein [Prolixibacteraceae bacterium]|nr:nucleotidyltransferase domain-containing protein [Prolixibacteraceae bacterium]
MKDQLVDNRIKYGLEDAAIGQIVSILESNPKIEKIVLFGSRAKGNFQNGSDVDISLIGKELGLNDILNASIEIDELALPYKFDLVIYDRIKEKSLLDHIDRVGIILFERDRGSI